jgi:hypothetical protein
VTEATPSPQVFRTLALLYLVTNARYGSGAKRRRLQRVVTRAEREAVTAVLESLPATVARWSDGLAALEPFDIIEVRRPLSTLSSTGGGRWWAGPRDCREELAEHAPEGLYDSILVLWPASPDLPLCGWGCTIGPGDETGGAGFTSIATDHWPTLATDPEPARGYVHEWLHQVEAVYRGLGVGEDELPNLHDAGAYTSTRDDATPPFGRSYAEYHDGSDGHPGARTWAPWYRDWMTGRLRALTDGEPDPEAQTDDTPAIGLTPSRWALRTSGAS